MSEMTKESIDELLARANILDRQYKAFLARLDALDAHVLRILEGLK